MSETLSDTPSIQESHLEEYKNEHLTAKVEMLPACIANVHLTITPEASQAAYNRAVKAVSKEVSIPGFRKGKAPAEKLIKQFGKSIDSEWQQQLLQTSIIEAVSLIPNKPLANDSITSPKVIKASRNENSEVSFQMECTPVVPEINIEELTVATVEAEPATDDAMNEELQNIRFHRAVWEPIEDRNAQEGDYVDLTIVSLEEPSSTLCENARFTLQEGKMSEWMRKLIIGMKVGDTAEGTSEKDQNLEDPEGAFVPTRCSITLNGIFQAVLPELNDEFAQSIGADSLADLEEKVKTRITNVNKQKASQAMEGQVIEQLLSKYQFDIPVRECEQEKAIQYERLRNELESAEGSPAEKVRMIQEVERYISGLPNNYRLYFMARQIAKKFNISVTEKELANEITYHLMLNQASYNSLIDESMDPRQVQKMMFNHLLIHKTIDFIVKNSQAKQAQ